jgi:hypothetical protein
MHQRGEAVGGWNPLFWAMLTAVAAVGLALALSMPALTFPVLAAVGGISALAAGFRWPRALIGATLLVAISVQTAQQLLPQARGPISSMDEIFVLLCVVCVGLPRLGRLRWFPGSVGFGLFVACGLISSAVRDVPVSLSLTGMFLLIKGLMVGWAAAQLDWDPSAIRWVIRGGAVVFGVAIACAVLNVLFPQAWVSLMKVPLLYRTGGIPSLIGPWKHPSFFGQIMAMISVAALAYWQVFGQRGRLVAAVAAVAALLSFRRKTLLSLLAASGFLLWRKQRFLLVLLAAPALGLIVVIAWSAINQALDVTLRQYLFDADETPRTLLLLGSGAVAAEYFPFGAGFGRYGSYLAMQEYSPEYVRLGFRDVYGFIPGRAENFATDTFWPAILGETGWLGVAGYAGGLVGMAQVIRGSGGHASPWVRWAAATAAGWFILLLVESVAAPVFSGPPTYPFLFAVVGVLIGARRHAEIGDEPKEASAAASAARTKTTQP